jgi:uncharacterized protein YbbC (DUF1343 family)
MIKKGGLEERSKDIFSRRSPEEKFRGEITAGKVKSTFWAQFLDLRPHLEKPSGLRRIYFVITFSLLLLSASGCGREKSSLNEPWPTSSEMMKSGVVKPGIEILLEKHLDKLRAKKVGLITNPTGVDSNLVSTIERLRSLPGVKLVALYGPEHGVRGNAQAGEYVPFYVDEKYGLPVFSLYGQSLKPPQDMLLRLDEFMRSFDTTEAGKIPEHAMVKEIEVMLFDLQDVGTRVYTYIATMAYAMEACAEAGIPFMVLDRPNPINGVMMEGPILKYPEFSSFVGLYPIPLRHGMTAGELALLFNEKYLKKKARLTVIPMENWKRQMWFDETGLPWVIPSPNMPTLDTATVYPGQVLFEGTNVSEGRGTTRPFELCGAPWIDGYELAKEMNRIGLPGVRFREAWFTPTFSKYRGELCGGVQIHVLDRNVYEPVRTSLILIQTIKKMYPDKFKFHETYFDKIMGTDEVRKWIEAGWNIEELITRWAEELRAFASERKPFLLYK